jgi:large subunit ribosomal protein L21
MYAVIATGGKQYKVAEGDVIRVEKLGAEDGAEVTFDNVIAINTDKDVLVGDNVSKSTVKATVVKTAKAKKVVVYRYKRKSGYHKKNGHRQPFTAVKIDSIEG